jgi:hypothetical protein
MKSDHHSAKKWGGAGHRGIGVLGVWIVDHTRFQPVEAIA